MPTLHTPFLLLQKLTTFNLFTRSNNKFSIFLKNFSTNYNESRLFHLCIIVFSSKRSVWLTQYWKFMKTKFESPCWIRWTLCSSICYCHLRTLSSKKKVLCSLTLLTLKGDIMIRHKNLVKSWLLLFSICYEDRIGSVKRKIGVLNLEQ